LFCHQAVPEAVPKQIYDFGESRSQRNERRRSLFGAAQQPRIYPVDNEISFSDAARAWTDPNADHGLQPPLDRDTFSPIPDPFQFDVNPAFSADSIASVGIRPVGGQELMPSSGIASCENMKGADGRALRNASSEGSIDAARIPAPRVCGAAFGPGVGGLSIFHNGDMKQMWSWYDRNVVDRRSSVPHLVGAGSGINVEAIATPPGRDFPRTLQDLIGMTTAAKQAQWGENDESDDSSVSFRADVDNFFEDDSDASSEGVGMEGAKAGRGRYDSYFSESQRLLSTGDATSEPSETSLAHRKSTANRAFVASSDVLSPEVRVSFAFDNLSLNNQSVYLARNLKLGELDSCKELFDHTILPSNLVIGFDHASSKGMTKEVPPYLLAAGSLPKQGKDTLAYY
jgi:hypothetical protein